ncbi:MAG: hypothetical protein AAF335_03265 [Bacteroidota bacterium]
MNKRGIRLTSLCFAISILTIPCAPTTKTGKPKTTTEDNALDERIDKMVADLFSDDFEANFKLAYELERNTLDLEIKEAKIKDKFKGFEDNLQNFIKEYNTRIKKQLLTSDEGQKYKTLLAQQYGYDETTENFEQFKKKYTKYEKAHKRGAMVFAILNSIKSFEEYAEQQKDRYQTPKSNSILHPVYCDIKGTKGDEMSELEKERASKDSEKKRFKNAIKETKKFKNKQKKEEILREKFKKDISLCLSSDRIHLFKTTLSRHKNRNIAASSTTMLFYLTFFILHASGGKTVKELLTHLYGSDDTKLSSLLDQVVNEITKESVSPLYVALDQVRDKKISIWQTNELLSQIMALSAIDVNVSLEKRWEEKDAKIVRTRVKNELQTLLDDSQTVKKTLMAVEDKVKLMAIIGHLSRENSVKDFIDSLYPDTKTNKGDDDGLGDFNKGGEGNKFSNKNVNDDWGTDGGNKDSDDDDDSAGKGGKDDKKNGNDDGSEDSGKGDKDGKGGKKDGNDDGGGDSGKGDKDGKGGNKDGNDDGGGDSGKGDKDGKGGNKGGGDDEQKQDTGNDKGFMPNAVSFILTTTAVVSVSALILLTFRRPKKKRKQAGHKNTHKR